MHVSAGLSVFENLDRETGYERARTYLEAIEIALNRFDRLRDEAGLLCTQGRVIQCSGNRARLN